MSAGNSGRLPELSGFNENGFENVESAENSNSQPLGSAIPEDAGVGETLATADAAGLEVATAEPAATATAPNTTKKKGRDYTTQAQVLGDINEAIKRMYPEDKKKAHIAVVGPALKAKKEGSNSEYREAVELAAERVHQGLSFPKKTVATTSKRRSRLTNALNAARQQENSGMAPITVASSMNTSTMGTAAATAAPPRQKRSRATAAAAASSRNTALANVFPSSSNSVLPISASATTNEKERLLASLTTMKNSAKEMIDSMYAAANKLARGAAASNNGGLLRAVNSGVSTTVTRKVRKNKGISRGPRSTAKVPALSALSALPALSPIPEETNSAVRGENNGTGEGNTAAGEGNTARVNNLSALEPSPVQAGMVQQEGNTALGP
jgi:hypothetical protein